MDISASAWCLDECMGGCVGMLVVVGWMCGCVFMCVVVGLMYG